MSHHNILHELPGPQWDAVSDPGDSGAIPRDQAGLCNLVTAGSETRTLGDPVRSGVLLGLNFLTDGGDCTVTVTNGYDEAGATTLTFTDAGQFALLISRKVGSNHRWRLVGLEPGTTFAELQYLDVTLGTGEASKAMTLDANGDYFHPNDGAIVVGHTAQETVSTGDGSTDMAPETQILGTAQADASLLLGLWSTTDALGPMLAFAKSGNAAIGSHTTVADNEYLGRIVAFGDDGTDLESPAAEIRFVVDDTPATGEMAGSIEFWITADGGETLTQRWTINAAGALVAAEASDIVLGTTTGTKIGTAVSQKLGFFNATPVVQPADAGQASLTNSTGGSADGTLSAISGSGDDANINNNFTELHTLLDEVRTALVNLGLIKGAA